MGDRMTPPVPTRLETAFVVGAFLVVFYVSQCDRPILDDYVGRQIPTAMVARNISRGTSFFRPQLDTGPFPNLFLVEPPIYAGLVALLSRVASLRLEPAGRLVSVCGMGLAAWGLMGLAARRGGAGRFASPFIAMTFLALPVCLRFGSDFQPDALALGMVVAGLRLWDDDGDDVDRRTVRRILAWTLLAGGLATKVLTTYILVPLVVSILRPVTPRKILVALSTLLPAILWYVYATWTMRDATGSRASSDNALLWLRALSLAPLLDFNTYRAVVATIAWRTFTPVGFTFAVVGAYVSRRSLGARDQLWLSWFASASAMLVVASGKIHHQYYFLALAPVVAFWAWLGYFNFVVNCWANADRVGQAPDAESLPTRCPRHTARFYALMLFPLVPIALAWLSGPSSHELTAIPAAWRAWPNAVASIQRRVPNDTLLAAPEAILYLADREGCRLEYEPKSRIRAAGEWGATIDAADPLALVEFYRSKGAKFVCDLWPVSDEPDRRDLQDSIRRRYKVIVDRDGVILAELVDRE